LFREGKIAVGIEAAITLILMAGIPVFVKFTSANTFTIGIFRLGVAATLLILVFNPATLKSLLRKKMIIPLVLIGLFFAMHWITYFLSIKKATASIGILGMSTYGIHLIFLGWFFRDHKPAIWDFIALAFAMWGTYYIVPEFSLSNDIAVGVALGIFSGFCFAVLPVLHQHYSNIPEKLRIIGQLTFALMFFLFFLPETNWHLQNVDWWALLYLAIPGTFIAHSLWIRVTTHLPTTVSSLIFYLIVPMTMVISHFWLGEEMPFQKVAGATLVVAGNAVSFVGRARVKKKV